MSLPFILDAVALLVHSPYPPVIIHLCPSPGAHPAWDSPSRPCRREVQQSSAALVKTTLGRPSTSRPGPPCVSYHPRLRWLAYRALPPQYTIHDITPVVNQGSSKVGRRSHLVAADIPALGSDVVSNSNDPIAHHSSPWLKSSLWPTSSMRP